MSSLYSYDAMGGVINIITARSAKLGKPPCVASRWQENGRSGDIYESNFYTAMPMIEDLLGVKINSLLLRYGEYRIIKGYNGQRMKSGGGTFTLTPNDTNSFDLNLGILSRIEMALPINLSTASNPPSDVRYMRNHSALTHYGNYDGGMTPIICGGRKPAIRYGKWNG